MVSKIKKILTRAIQDILNTNGYGGKTQWANREFNPSGLNKWARVSIIPNIPEAVSLGQGGRDRVTGFVQIDINVPQDTGDKEFDLMEEQFRAAFIAGQHVNTGSELDPSVPLVTVISTGMGPGRFVDNFFRRSLSINYRADLIRGNFQP